MKPYYQDDAVTIYHGDCREILPLEADLLLTDPPYGEVNRASGGLRSLDKGVADTKTLENDELAALLVEVPATSVYIWCGTEQVSDLRRVFVDAGFTTRLAIWEKSNPSPMNGEHLWLSGLEACVFARRSGAAFNEHCRNPIWRGSSAPANEHTTPKPLWLMKRLVAASSDPGQTVLDPFMGSGTTLRAAKDLGRKAIGIELEERYCENAAERCAQEVLDLGAAA
jgi:site-specific DNA-methyltransferase (adenine-specific)